VQTQYTFDPFGSTTSTGASTTNVFQYTGRENDGSGIYYYRARYYNAALQRFVSEDPIGVSGGINLYSYAANAPPMFIDPFGYAPKDKWWGYNDRDFQDWYHKFWKQPGIRTRLRRNWKKHTRSGKSRKSLAGTRRAIDAARKE